jgi:hypothetical protein
MKRALTILSLLAISSTDFATGPKDLGLLFRIIAHSVSIFEVSFS